LIVESKYVQAQQSLQEVLALGVTYDDLIAEGMHPKFLDQLFARIKLPSPQTDSRAPSVPLPTASPDPAQMPLQRPIPMQSAAQSKPSDVDVDNFLDTLEPSISAPNDGNGSKKRGLPIDSSTQIPKRRAFGLVPPKELVIDVSDDEDDEEEDEVKKPQAPNVKAHPRPVKIPNRPALTQQVRDP
jgi:hypothetical protein